VRLVRLEAEFRKRRRARSVLPAFRRSGCRGAQRTEIKRAGRLPISVLLRAPARSRCHPRPAQPVHHGIAIAPPRMNGTGCRFPRSNPSITTTSSIQADDHGPDDRKIDASRYPPPAARQFLSPDDRSGTADKGLSGPPACPSARVDLACVLGTFATSITHVFLCLSQIRPDNMTYEHYQRHRKVERRVFDPRLRPQITPYTPRLASDLRCGTIRPGAHQTRGGPSAPRSAEKPSTVELIAPACPGAATFQHQHEEARPTISEKLQKNDRGVRRSSGRTPSGRESGCFQRWVRTNC